MKKTTLVVSALVLGLSMGAAHAGSVVTETRITPKPYVGPDIVDYNVFDVNADGNLTMAEVGEKLFYTFDGDGNQLVDNIEWSKPVVMTFAPVEKEELRSVDWNGDGILDTTTITRQRFLQESGLSRFDQHGNGLSAAEFLNKPFKKADRDLSGQIDIKEWKEAYMASLRPLPQNDTFRYNE